MDIFVVYNDENTIKELKDGDFGSSSFHFINTDTLKGRKEGNKLKYRWGTKLEPFVMIFNEDIPIKGFWKESSKDPIKDLINFLQDND